MKCHIWGGTISHTPVYTRNDPSGKQLRRKGPGESWLTARQQCALVPKKPSGSFGSSGQCFAGSSREVTLPPLQHWKGHIWSPGSSSGLLSTRDMERVQPRAMKIIHRLEHLTCEERLGELRLLSWRRKSLEGNLITVHKYLEGECREDGPRLLSEEPRDRTWGNEHKQKHRSSPLNIRKHLLMSLVTQKGCGVSTLGYMQKSSGHSSGQLALSVSAWAGIGWTNDLQRSPPTSTIPWHRLRKPARSYEKKP